MDPGGTEQRALKLAESAKDLLDAGEGEKATRALREAFHLAPLNEQIQEIAQSIQASEHLQPLLKLCQKFAEENDTAAGQDAVWLLASAAAKTVSNEVAKQALELVLDAGKLDPAIRNDVVAGLLQQCLGARRYIARRLEESASVIFEQLFSIGDGAANGITVVSLDASAWSSEAIRRLCEQDVFILFLAKLLESGHDNDGRALKGISRHLAVDAKRLHIQVDEQSFAAIVACLDYRLSEEVRSQATLATAKYLEAAEQTGQEYLTKFITTRTAKHGSEDLVLAFSVAAAVFPIATELCSALFLVEGFLPSLIPLLDKKSRPIKVEKAALDMLSAACIDAGCRTAIAKYCWDWMHHVMEDEEDERHGQAALILAKVQSAPADPADKKTMGRHSSKQIADVVPKLKEMVIDGSEFDQRTGIEGLAYASVLAVVKENIVNDTALLRRLFRLPKKDSISPTTAFGYLTLIDNITRDLPALSEEQKKLSDLRAYANASKPQGQPHPLDENDAVSKRCTRCVDAQVVPFLITLKQMSIASPLSPNCLLLLAKILLSLAKTPSHRGLMVQQGALPLLLQICNPMGIKPLPNHAPRTIQHQTKMVAAHAIARILISVDPNLLLIYIVRCLGPLTALLFEYREFKWADQPYDLLPIFESLLAITNLTSDQKFNSATVVVMAAWDTIEDLLYNSNKMVQQGAMELMCNLVNMSSAGLEKVADGSKAANRYINLFVALCDAETLATRSAAGGALASALEFPGPIKAVLAREGGIKRILKLCQEDDAGCVHRATACLYNLVNYEGEEGKEIRDIVRAEGGRGVLLDIRRRFDDAFSDYPANTLKLLKKKEVLSETSESLE